MSTKTAAAPIENPLARLSDEQIEQIGREFDALHDEVYEDLGERDRAYITSVITMQRRLVSLARVLLLAAHRRPTWIAGMGTLSAAKILENMELGHNIMHGQWDWMNDPQIHSTSWDWDTASTAESWKHHHNYIHHTYTNILGKDKDLGYEIMRIDPNQSWHPVYLFQPLYNALLMVLFEWGVAVHDLDLEAVRKGEKSLQAVAADLKGISGKAWAQFRKDYFGWPLVSALAAGAATAALESRGAFERPRAGLRGGALGRWARRRKRQKGLTRALRAGLEQGRQTFTATVKANVTANIVRNVWAHSIIFCGHFPDQTYVFTPEEVADESRGAWYVRQLVGAANISGSPLFHVASGNLSYQVEHHLYPDMPSSRYSEIAPRVQEICERYGLPYNVGPLHQQLGMVHRTILRLALPGGKPRPKPGAYKGGDGELRPTPPRADGDGQPHGLRTGGKTDSAAGPDRSLAGVRVSIPD